MKRLFLLMVLVAGFSFASITEETMEAPFIVYECEYTTGWGPFESTHFITYSTHTGTGYHGINHWYGSQSIEPITAMEASKLCGDDVY